jgi:hypothetical protein
VAESHLVVGSRLKSNAEPARAATVSLVLITLAVLAWPASAAVAFGGGYGPPGFPGPGGPGGMLNVVTARSVPAAGGTISGSANGASVIVNVPNGTFPQGGELVISSESPCGLILGKAGAVLADFRILAVDPSTEQLLRGPFHPALSVTVTDRAIDPGDSVVEVTTPGHSAELSDAYVASGTATVALQGLPSLLAVVSTNWWKCFLRPRPHAVRGPPLAGSK